MIATTVGAAFWRMKSIWILQDIFEQRSRRSAAARRQLIRLDRASVTLEQLYSTRIGVAVGDVLGCAELQGLWPLARAFCSWWAQQLPQETRDAIQYVQDVARREQDQTSTAAVVATSSAPDVAALPQQPVGRR